MSDNATAQRLKATFGPGTVPLTGDFVALIDAAEQAAALIEPEPDCGLVIEAWLLELSKRVFDGIVSVSNVSKLSPARRQEIYGILQNAYKSISSDIFQPLTGNRPVGQLSIGLTPLAGALATDAERHIVAIDGTAERNIASVSPTDSTAFVPHGELLSLLGLKIALETRFNSRIDGRFLSDGYVNIDGQLLKSVCLAHNSRVSPIEQVCLAAAVANSGDIVIISLDRPSSENGAPILVAYMIPFDATRMWYDANRIVRFNTSELNFMEGGAAYICIDDSGSNIFLSDGVKILCTAGSSGFLAPIKIAEAIDLSGIFGLACSGDGLTLAVLLDAVGDTPVRVAILKKIGTGAEFSFITSVSVRDAKSIEMSKSGKVIVAGNRSKGQFDVIDTTQQWGPDGYLIATKLDGVQGKFCVLVAGDDKLITLDSAFNKGSKSENLYDLETHVDNFLTGTSVAATIVDLNGTALSGETSFELERIFGLTNQPRLAVTSDVFRLFLPVAEIGPTSIVRYDVWERSVIVGSSWRRKGTLGGTEPAGRADNYSALSRDGRHFVVVERAAPSDQNIYNY